MSVLKTFQQLSQGLFWQQGFALTDMHCCAAPFDNLHQDYCAPGYNGKGIGWRNQSKKEKAAG